jgi:hypothetical protein
MFVRVLAFSLLAFLPLFGYSANIVINPVTGFSDATVTNAIGGNPGETLGAQRLNTFQKAANILETFLDIQIDVKVDASFSSLDCSSGSATLGSAGSTGGLINSENAPLANTIYPIALANNLALQDYNNTSAEITATFNANLDNNANCLNGVDWYYGYDDPTLAGAAYVNDISFLSVVIHELLHGLGVSSWVSSNGALFSGFMDAYSASLYDQTSSKSWSAMNNSERQASMTNVDNLVWTGPNVNTSTAALALTDGMNNGKVEMYAPSPFESGSSVSHFSTSATPNEIMEPSYTEFLTTPGMATQLLQDMGWAIAEANNAPILASIGALSSVEDNNKLVTLSATDADGDNSTFSASSDNVSVTASISGTTLTLTPEANYFGSANITVSVSDGSLSDTETVTYTVSSDNDLPVFTSAASGSTQYGNNLEVTLTATDVETSNDNITFAVQSSDSSQVTASLSGAILTLAPVNNYVGNTAITLRATDLDSGTTDQLYSLNITSIPNTAPVLATIGAQSSNEDTAKIINLAASDGEGDSLMYSATSDNAAVTASVSGTTLTLTPEANYFGSANITVSVSDGSLSDTETVTYTVSSDNDLPVFTSAASGSTQYGNNLEVTLTATDVETSNDNITFAVQSSDSSQVTASLSGAILTLAPVNNYVGNTAITLRATDLDSGTTDQLYSLNITSIPNTAPVLATIGAQSSNEDTAKIINLAASDGEGDSLMYSATSDNAAVTASVSGTTLTLTPEANYFGSANITVSVSDGSLPDTETVTYTVSSDNDLPVFTSAASGSTQYGNNLEVTLTATDVETSNDNITFEVQSSDSSQVTASLSGAILTLAPVNNYVGDTALILRATDTDGGTSDQNYVLTISPAANEAPIFFSSDNLTTLYSNSLTHSLTASDANSDELTFDLVSLNSAQVVASLTGSTLTLKATNNFTGNTSIEVSVDDGSISMSQTIDLTIYDDFSLVSNNGTLSQGDSLGITNSSFEFSLGGGNNNYSVGVVFDGQDSSHELLTLSAGRYFLAMPDSGAFAGDYTIMISDSNGETANFTVQRPLKVTTNINQLISNSVTQEMYIEGAPAGSVLDLYINNGTGLVDLKIDNAIITQVEAPDNANSFNRAVVQLDVNDASTASIINISADSAVLPAGDVSLTILPFHDLALTITDLSGIGISTSIIIDDDRFVVWGLNQQRITDNSGAVVLALPTEQATTISLNAENYQTRTVEVSAQLNSLTLVLELLENPMTVSGSITTSTLNFVSENPVVQLIAVDGSVMLAELSGLSANSVSYSITINKLAFDADKLTITIGDITQEIRLINNQIDSTINININALQVTPGEIPNIEEPIVEITPAVGSSYILIFSLLLLINCRKRRTLLIPPSD